jgi:hypothetical protein
MDENNNKKNHKYKRLEKIKLKGGIEEPIRAKKVASMINSVNQQNPKLNNVKSKE